MGRVNASQLTSSSLFLLLLWIATVSMTWGGDRPGSKGTTFAVSDEFYRAHSIDSTKIVERLGKQEQRSEVKASAASNITDTRRLEVAIGFDSDGARLSYTITGKVFVDAFLDEETLAKAFRSRAFIFPKAGWALPEPPLSKLRQDTVFDIKLEQFHQNPFGLWLLTFVSWDRPNVDKRLCRWQMDKLAAQNGVDRDRTPVLKSVSTMERMEKQGCVRHQYRPLDGSQGYPWVVTGFHTSPR